MKKLSELSDETILLVTNDLHCMTKKEFLESSYFLDGEVCQVVLGQREVEHFDLDAMIEEKAENMYEDWDEHVMSDFTKEEWGILRNAEEIINKVFNNRATYYEGDLVKVDKDGEE
jgi:hypothetical protein